MIWKIVKKESLLNLTTFKFSLGTLPCIVLSAAFIPFFADDYQQRPTGQMNCQAYSRISPMISFYRPVGSMPDIFEKLIF